MGTQQMCNVSICSLWMTSRTLLNTTHTRWKQNLPLKEYRWLAMSSPSLARRSANLLNFWLLHFWITLGPNQDFAPRNLNGQTDNISNRRLNFSWCSQPWQKVIYWITDALHNGLHTCEKRKRDCCVNRASKLGWGEGFKVFLRPVLKKCSAVDESKATFRAIKTIGRKRLFIARSDFTGTNVGLETTWDYVAAKESFFRISQLHRAVRIVEGLFCKFKKLKYFTLRKNIPVFPNH